MSLILSWRAAVAVAILALLSTLVSVMPSATAAAVDEYAGLGDSYSSGNGAFSSNLGGCGRNTYAYPYLVSQSRPNTHLTFVACEGAVTGDIINSQVNSLNAETDYVSLTIGGNDIGFANLIINCAGSWSPTCKSAVDEANRKIRDELPAKLDAAYAAIKSHAPNRRAVAVLGYPKVFNPKNLNCAGANGITEQEAVWANEVAANLDAVISGRAAAAGFTYKSNLAVFSNHEVCARDPYVNGKSWSIADGYHPTRSGYANAMAPEVRAVIG